MMITDTKEATTVASRQELAAYLDATKLGFQPDEDPEVTIRALCAETKQEAYRSVCVRPYHVALAKRELAEANCHIATVIGFPQEKSTLAAQRQNPTFGNVSLEEKLSEMAQTKADGATEYDIVLNTAWFLSLPEDVEFSSDTEIAQLAQHSSGLPIKLIIETDLLTDAQVIKATQWSIAAGIEYVKTSTGMLSDGNGATVHHIKLIHQTIQHADAAKEPGIKASGGIKTWDDANQLIAAGADILGTSAPLALLNEFDASR